MPHSQRFALRPTSRLLAGGGAVSAGGDSALSKLWITLARQDGLRVSQGGVLPMPDAPGILECTTSGTTGRPKIIRRSHASWCASFAINARLFSIGPGSETAVLGDVGHSLALYGLVEALCLGATAHSLAGLRPDRQVRQLGESGVSLLYATPTQLRALCARAKGPLPDLRHVVVGGGALDASTHANILRLCPNAGVTQFYGAAETSFITLSDADTPDGAVGRAYPGVEIALRGSDGRPAPGLGEVWVRSPYLFDGYAEGGSNAARRDGDWLSVGEMGQMDADGCLWLVGRRDRMVTVSDVNVFPEAVEAAILSLPGLTQVAVLPRPDALRGQILVAVMPGEADAELIANVQSVARAVCGDAAVPRQVCFCPHFPVTGSGKPDLAKLALWLETQP